MQYTVYSVLSAMQYFQMPTYIVLLLNTQPQCVVDPVTKVTPMCVCASQAHFHQVNIQQCQNGWCTMGKRKRKSNSDRFCRVCKRVQCRMSSIYDQ